MIISQKYYHPISHSYGIYDCNAIRSRELEVENYLKKFADNEIYYLDLATIINNLKILVSLQRDFYNRFYFDNVNKAYCVPDDNSFLNFINKALAQYLEKVLENFDDLLTTDTAVASQYLEKNITLLFELTNSQSSPIAKFGLQHHTVFSFNSHGNEVEVTFFSKIQNDNLSKLIDQRSRIINIQSELNHPDSLEGVSQHDSEEKKSENSPSHPQLTIDKDPLKPFLCKHLFVNPPISESYSIAEDEIATDEKQNSQSSSIDSSQNSGQAKYISTDPREIINDDMDNQSAIRSRENEEDGLGITRSSPESSNPKLSRSDFGSHVDESSLVQSFINPNIVEIKLFNVGSVGPNSISKDQGCEKPISPRSIEVKLHQDRNPEGNKIDLEERKLRIRRNISYDDIQVSI